VTKFLISLILSILLIRDISAGQVSFIAMGDWGRGGNFGQKETAAQMGSYTDLSAFVGVSCPDNSGFSVQMLAKKKQRRS
jgi:hypothetical protein